jgi:hypothetical protein
MKIASTFRIIFCGLLTASTVSAQQPQAGTDPSAVLTLQRNQTAQLAATWLHSGDPRLQAWGAYVVLRDHHESLIPDLVKTVSGYEVAAWPIGDSRRDQHDAMIAILDTVIELTGPISPSDAARLYPEFPVQSLILLSREGDSAFPYLLEIFRTEHLQRDAWLAAGNELAQRRFPGFATAVLGSFTFQARIRVTTSGASEAAQGSGGSCASSGEGNAGWPVVGNYSFAGRRAGAILLADGIDPAYYMRWVNAGYDRDRGRCCGPCSVDPIDLNLYREHYLAVLLSAPQASPPLRSSFNETIIWRDSAGYLAHLRDVVQRQDEAFLRTAGKLGDAGLMTPEEVAMVMPKLEITIVDDREDKTTPLPRPDNLGNNVVVKM